jgi:hypothetical protein
MSPGQQYLSIRNRNEKLIAAPDDSGFECDWQWTSDLHAPKVLPSLGRRLMRKMLADHSVQFSEVTEPASGAAPELTFLIGHRGMERLPHLLTTLKSIASQKRAVVECIVIEQDVVSKLGPHLPAWVKLVHTPPPAPDMPYCRSWTFNIGANHARGAVLVLHDNDMLVPQDYAAHILARVAHGYQVVNPKRFIFYLSEEHSKQLFEGRSGLCGDPPEAIVQNLEGGGSIAITRQAYADIGGLDESFVGWGGEDNEFWERAQTLNVWTWASLPLVHLWHAAQKGKGDAQYHTAKHYRHLANINATERISRLKTVAQGRLTGPATTHQHGTNADATL